MSLLFLHRIVYYCVYQTKGERMKFYDIFIYKENGEIKWELVEWKNNTERSAKIGHNQYNQFVMIDSPNKHFVGVTQVPLSIIEHL